MCRLTYPLNRLADVHFADHVAEIAHGENVDPRNMILEITESAATTDVSHALENLVASTYEGFRTVR